MLGSVLHSTVAGMYLPGKYSVLVKEESSFVSPFFADDILTVTENGYGKRSLIGEYRITNRGGKGVINIKTSDRNGKVVSIKTVKDNHELMLISKKGKIIRISASNISQVGRNAQGVRIMKFDDDKLVSVARIITTNVNSNKNLIAEVAIKIITIEKDNKFWDEVRFSCG